MTLWLQVSTDEYELPEVVAESAKELASMVGVTPNTIYSTISHAKKKHFKSKYIKIRIQGDL